METRGGEAAFLSGDAATRREVPAGQSAVPQDRDRGSVFQRRNEYMVRATGICLVACWLLVSAQAADAKSWIIENYQLQDGPFYQVTGGGYNGANYHWSDTASIQRAYWHFDFADASSRPALYFVEQWVPSVLPSGVTAWQYLPIEVTFNGDGSGEEATNQTGIPWNGAYGTNHQWLSMNMSGLGHWQQAGPGPQAPANAACGAAGSGSHMWMKKGSTLYTKWLFPFASKHAITALRVTEVVPTDVPAVCDAASAGGPIDLRCVGNSDPIYEGTELYGNGPDSSVDGNSFGVEGYAAPSCFATNTPLSPGLPASKLYTAHLPATNVTFRLRSNGMNSVKWKDDDSGTYARANVFVLNGQAGREFVPDKYAKLYLLTAKGGGTNSQLLVEAIYADDTIESSLVNLYDWFNQDGEDAALAVGSEGLPRRSSEDVVGFRRVGSDGAAGNGADHGGAFMFADTVQLNKSKVLKQIRLSIGDQGLFDGELCVFAANLEVGCNSPAADVAGAGGEPDGAVDQLDFAVFQNCYTGAGDPSGLFNRAQCGCLDSDGDSDIDADDYSAFNACASGPGIAADAGCGP
jgi:hypothetical protein